LRRAESDPFVLHVLVKEEVEEALAAIVLGLDFTHLQSSGDSLLTRNLTRLTDLAHFHTICFAWFWRHQKHFFHSMVICLSVEKCLVLLISNQCFVTHHVVVIGE
jgi:hypothetical protein